ncbi:MAG: MarR family transcriptional regulator [Verrucomicrobia bacterium]|nr:MarR family transcriptional regulator [Verrucomicrobiota bacterium]
MPRTQKSAENLAKEDYELLAEFRYTLRKFLGFSEAAAASHKVTAQQYQALLAIEGFPGRNWVTIGELAEQLRTAHHSTVGLIDRMEALRLVRRAKSEEDKRRVQVTLTRTGRDVLEKLYRAHRTELKTVGPRLIGLLQKAAQKTPSIPAAKGFASPACSMPEIED